jgi:hypothetical protein
MLNISRTLSALLLALIAATASAQTPTHDDISKQLDDQILNAIDSHRISDRALMLALGEAEANAGASELRAAINRQRTDLQLGATSNSPHATSVLERPGIADLLSLALDRGAITKAAAGTGLTLSTTPYAIWTGFGARDTPQLWKNAAVARNLSFGATFSSTDVTTGDFSSFTSGEVKYVITGNRSPRDPALLRGVRAKLGATFRVADNDMDRACGWLLNTDSLLTARTEMDNWLQSNRTATAADVRAHLDAIVGRLTVDQVSLKPCIAAITAGEQSISGGLDAVTEATKAYLAEHPQQLSVATLFVRDATLSDYYVAKLLYGYDFAPLTVNANAEASWNKKSTTAVGAPVRSLRAYSVEFGVNSRTFANGRLDGSIASKASRDKAADAKSSVVAEAKLNIHLTDVLRLPIAFSYANRETETIKQGWQLNVGVNALLDEVLRRLK